MPQSATPSGKIDLKATLKELYGPSAKQVQLVDVPPFNFLMVDGRVEPGETPETSPQFQQAFGALYGASYTLKFMSKLRPVNPVDYTVMPLEGLWWTEGGGFDFERKDEWRWTMMVMQPDHIDEAMYQQAVAQLKAKRDNPAIAKMRFERFHEGLCVQIMHLGPYTEEPRTIEAMHRFARENGYRLRGKHHEIYLGDPRRTKPERLRTILRHPVEKA